MESVLAGEDMDFARQWIHTDCRDTDRCCTSLTTHYLQHIIYNTLSTTHYRKSNLPPIQGTTEKRTYLVVRWCALSRTGTGLVVPRRGQQSPISAPPSKLCVSPHTFLVFGLDYRF